jgi:small subunit ribosomal protein S16
MDSRQGRDSCPIEELGHYDPMCADAKTQTVLNIGRLRYWLSVGAQPSHKVQVLLNKFGVKKPAPGEPWEVATPVADAPAASPAPAATPAEA